MQSKWKPEIEEREGQDRQRNSMAKSLPLMLVWPREKLQVVDKKTHACAVQPGIPSLAKLAGLSPTMDWI